MRYEVLYITTHQPDVNKIYLFEKDLFEAKHQLLTNKRKSVGLNQFDESNVFIEYSNDMDDFYENFDECNPHKKIHNTDYI